MHLPDCMGRWEKGLLIDHYCIAIYYNQDGRQKSQTSRNILIKDLTIYTNVRQYLQLRHCQVCAKAFKGPLDGYHTIGIDIFALILHLTLIALFLQYDWCVVYDFCETVVLLYPSSIESELIIRVWAHTINLIGTFLWNFSFFFTFFMGR